MLLVPWVIPPAMSCLAGCGCSIRPTARPFVFPKGGDLSNPVDWRRLWTRRDHFCQYLDRRAFFHDHVLGRPQIEPEQLYEAAAVDGANWWQRTRYVTLPMMRNIIAITALFSLIVTFANFDIVRILTAGGPIDQTHIFATWAFRVRIESGDIPSAPASRCSCCRFSPLPRSSSCATSIGGERDMTAVAVPSITDPERGTSAVAEVQQRPRLGVALVVFLPDPFRIVFLTPPVYMLITSLKTSAEISAATNPWWVYAPTLDNYAALLFQRSFLSSSATRLSCPFWSSASQC